MESLALKYRPQKFKEVVGQGNAVKILESQLKNNDIKQAYLFKGASGCGKTTCARIFANEVNEYKGKPIELNAADTNSVDDIRVIIDDAKFKPIDSKYKVYIIDEVHMLSKGAFNALLKILEEPPKHVIFILCTTDPQKIPKTVLSRLQKFDFKRMSNEETITRLEYILSKEGYEYELSALEYVAKLAEGGMRDAITLIDTVLSFTEEVSLAAVSKCLGDTQYKQLNDIVEGILDQDIPKCIKTVEDMFAEGKDLRQVVKELSRYTLDICKYYYTNSFDITLIPPDFYRVVKEIVNTSDIEFLLDLVDAFNKLDNRIRFDTNPKYVVESEIIILCR